MDASDDDLMVRVSGGDRQAFAILVRRHLDRVVALADRIIGDSSAAEDIAQEAMLRLWRQAPRWRRDGPARLSTWLYRVTVNLCLDHRRRPRPRALDQVPEPVQPPGPDGFTAVTRSETARRVEAALAALPMRQRLAFALCHYEGMTRNEAALVMETSGRAVESLLTRARRHLRRALADLVETNGSGQP